MSHVFGITGSIACGKSTVTRYMRKAGVPIVDADILAREVVALDTPGLGLVTQAFGQRYLLPDGTLNRPLLGSLVFENQTELNRLNKILHPLVRAEAERQTKVLLDSGHELVGYDSALIIETGLREQYLPLVVVTAPPDVQIDRLMRRNELTEAEARARISKQFTSEQKAVYADYVIETSGTLDELEQQVLSVLSYIKSSLNLDQKY